MKGEPGAGAQIAAQSLFTAASAANAIPVAGQFISAGLAIAGLFTKIFGGRRRKKAAERERKRIGKIQEERNLLQAAKGPGQMTGAAVGGEQAQGTVQTSSPVVVPQSSSFSSWGGGAAPSIQPTQQVLNKSLGL